MFTTVIDGGWEELSGREIDEADVIIGVTFDDLTHVLKSVNPFLPVTADPNDVELSQLVVFSRFDPNS